MRNCRSNLKSCPGVRSRPFEVVLPPRPTPDHPISFARRNGENKYWVSRSCRHSQAAWQFIEWMTRPDGFFAREYLRRGFGTLAFSDNKRHIQDPHLLKMAGIATVMRKRYPEAIVRNRELMRSKAFLRANSFRPDWEWTSMVEALAANHPFGPIAHEIAVQKNRILAQTPWYRARCMESQCSMPRLCTTTISESNGEERGSFKISARTPASSSR